jgi:hypothetical protein
VAVLDRSLSLSFFLPSFLSFFLGVEAFWEQYRMDKVQIGEHLRVGGGK